MAKRKTSVLENGLIWFGAAVSLAEILTGTALAPLGFHRGLTAVLLGHIIGCGLLFLAGLMGGQLRLSAMETVKRSFGRRGSLLFALLNIVQLLGWTAIMIYDGALAADGVWPLGQNLWCFLIGGLILLWILLGVEHLGKLNTVSMSALFLLTVLLSHTIFRHGIRWSVSGEAISFGAAVELSAAMPLSWLPLISDYTRQAEKPIKATAASAAVYGLVSCWMYIIGMGAAICTGESDIARILLQTGLGTAALIIVVLSTVTTTFLDAWSAGVSTESVFSRIGGKWAAAAVTVLGTFGAVRLPLGNITGFLYWIGSVFAPMTAVLLADYFLLNRDHSRKTVCISNLLLWLAGFVIYRLLMTVDIPTGNTLPDILITIGLCLAVNKLQRRKAS